MVETTPAGTPAAAPAAVDPVVLSFEADLEDTFAKMDALAPPTDAEASSPALRKFSLAISSVAAQQTVVKQFAENHFEKEGADAVLFRTVPSWISFERISGCRYRKVTKIQDTDDEFEHYQEHVELFGHPGASGWADAIGDVAIHYMGNGWAVFSKIFPFEEQADARAAHEDALLLGSTKHVMLTPSCVYRIEGVGGLLKPDAIVSCLTGEGRLGGKVTTVAKLPRPVTFRLFLTWGHEASEYAMEVKRFRYELRSLLDGEENVSLTTKATRVLSGLAARFANGGRARVEEHWVRYPAAPLTPSYYAQLLATATSQTWDEVATRELTEHHTPRGGVDDANAKVDINVLAGMEHGLLA